MAAAGVEVFKDPLGLENPRLILTRTDIRLTLGKSDVYKMLSDSFLELDPQILNKLKL